MSDPIDRAAEALWASIDDKGIRGRLFREDCDYLALTLDKAGLLVTPAHDAAVIRAALRPLRDYARQKGNLSARVSSVDTSEFLQAMANDLNRIMDRIEREGGTDV